MRARFVDQGEQPDPPGRAALARGDPTRAVGSLGASGASRHGGAERPPQKKRHQKRLQWQWGDALGTKDMAFEAI